MSVVKRPPLPHIDPQFGSVQCVCCEQFSLEEATRLDRYEKGVYRCEWCRPAGHDVEYCKRIHAPRD